MHLALFSNAAYESSRSQARNNAEGSTAARRSGHKRKKMVAFLNDHDSEMNCIATTEAQIKSWIEENFDCEWDEVKNIEDVTSFFTNVEEEDLADIFGEEQYAEI